MSFEELRTVGVLIIFAFIVLCFVAIQLFDIRGLSWLIGLIIIIVALGIYFIYSRR